MNISIGSYKVRVEILVAIVVVFCIIFGYLLYDCCKMNLFEGMNHLQRAQKRAQRAITTAATAPSATATTSASAASQIALAEATRMAAERQAEAERQAAERQAAEAARQEAAQQEAERQAEEAERQAEEAERQAAEELQQEADLKAALEAEADAAEEAAQQELLQAAQQAAQQAAEEAALLEEQQALLQEANRAQQEANRAQQTTDRLQQEADRLQQEADRASNTVTEGFSGNNYTSMGPEFASVNAPKYIMNPSTWAMQSLTYSPGTKPGAGVQDFWNRQKQQIPPPEGQLDFFAKTEFKPECCPNTYSTSTGCACMDMGSYTFLQQRGFNNIPFSAY